MESFLSNKRKISVRLKYTKIQLSQKHYWENAKIIDHEYRF